MNRPRRLSLRARMLVLLIGVTSLFLLIMGVVTTIVLSQRVGSQINSGVSAAVQRNPRLFAQSPGDYVGAIVAPLTGETVPLTSGQLTQAFQQALAQQTPAQYVEHAHGQAFTLTVPGGERLTAAERHIAAKAVTQAGYAPPGRVLVMVVARGPDEADGQVGGVVVAELITGGALLALLAAGGNWLIGRGLEPLDEMASTANEITSRGDLNARVAESGDQTEVGKLGSAINTMLDRIQQAFGARLSSEQKVREFAADASHELRTPLTTIRGYAELYRQGALGPDQLPNAMRRIEQEARRMSTLVAELLELARLDRTSSLDLTETDLAGVVRDAAADAIAVEPGRPVQAAAPARLVAMVDEARIRQVLANLLGNVRAHTPPDTPVVVRLASAMPPASQPTTAEAWPTAWVLLEVADAGPGMSPADAAKAFDRFHRGAERPSQPASFGTGPDQDDTVDHGGGSGLGLSIVQAIARAHGGHATLESWPGHGTRIRIWLPQ
jgi:signal transduction histidine kinase